MDTGLQGTRTKRFGRRSNTQIVARTVEGHSIRRSAAIAVVLGLSAIAFFGGHLFGRHRTSERASPSAAVVQDPPRATGEQSSLLTAMPESQGEAGPEVGVSGGGEDEDLPVASEATAVSDVAPAPVVSSADEAVDGLAFRAFAAPYALVSATTEPELGNAVGFSVDSFSDADVGAVTVNLAVTGPGGVSVAIHKGDRPDQSVRFVIPPNGRLLVPHLVAAADDQGRVVVSAEEQVSVEVIGLGAHVATGSSRAGRFVSMDSVRLGSLVTAVDGRDLVLDLNQVPGLQPAEVGHAILRLNANVGSNGGTVTATGDVSSGPVMWPAPPAKNLGLGGTALLLVAPDSTGQITLNYLGGAVLTADFVGYYTSESAPLSSAGLLVLETPMREDLLPGGSEIQIPSSTAETSKVLVLTATNGANAGPLAVSALPGLAEERPTFNIAPNQVRTTTVWTAENGDDQAYLSAPAGAAITIWHLGQFTS